MEELLNVLEKISSLYGPIYGTIFFVVLFGIFALLTFFYKRIDKIAEEISNKTLVKFDKKVQILFRDEVIRSSLRVQLAQDSIKKKLDFYEKIQKLYFEYQRSWLYTKETPEKEINELFKKILNAREEIFINSIYLGGYLSERLIKTVRNMYADLDWRIKEIKSIRQKYDSINYAMLVTDELELARKWLQENVFPDQTLKEYEFTKDEIKTLNEEKKELLNIDIK